MMKPWQDSEPSNLGDDVAGRAPPSPDRRRFLQGLGISGVVLAGCELLPLRTALPLVQASDGYVPGQSVSYATLCTRCEARCGVLAEVRDGRPIKLEGLPDDPRSRGGLCAAGQAELRALYDAGRLQRPLLGGVPVTWATLDEHVGAALADPLLVLTAPLTGVAERRAVAALVEGRDATWAEWVPPGDPTTAMAEAHARVLGVPRVPFYAIDGVEILVTIDADILGAAPSAVPYSAGYAVARGRRAAGGRFHHLAVEGTLSITGAAADRRWIQNAQQRRALLLHLAAAITGDAAPAEVGELARKLRAQPSLVLVGTADVAEQSLAAWINHQLGAAPSYQPWPRTEAQAALRRLVQGEFQSAVVVLVNPVEQDPLGAEVARALGAMPLSVYVGDRPTGTARACRSVAAMHHALESWGDAWTSALWAGLQQPTLRPMFDTRPGLESLLRWAGHDTSYQTWVAETWQQTWGTSLRDALARGGHAPEPAARPEIHAASLPQIEPMPGPGGYEVALVREVGVLEGAASFNPWVRELPDPMTRVAWLGVARVAPETARALDIADGTVLRITGAEGVVELPARIAPGQHPKVIGVSVGYGCVDGDGGATERNAYKLVDHCTVTLARTGAHVPLPLMQVASRIEGRDIVHQVARFDQRVARAHHGARSLWPRHPHAVHWEMIIDLDRCTGCGACVLACQAENNLPVVGPEEMTQHRDMHWLRVDRYFVGDDVDPQVLLEPMLCAQCDNAPCETVCPVAATVHSTDGLNQQVYNRCVGTRYCANNCPTKVRRFNWFDNKPTDPIERLALNPDVVVRDRGVMEKCTFCVQRIQRARIDAKNSGDKTPVRTQIACQQSCPTRAIAFGDGKAADSPLPAAARSPRAFKVLDELGIEPSITYLARIRDVHGGRS
jgi:molybdopterin-containing oxidoreductase family iron-sulfur binding subunit